VLGVTAAEGWLAVLAHVAEPGVGRRVRSEPLRCWGLSTRMPRCQWKVS
jgi:hypothetical protein